MEEQTNTVGGNSRDQTGEKSRTVTITGADGIKIVHSRQLPDRPRLLWELKQHCGEQLPADFPRERVSSSP